MYTFLTSLLTLIIAIEEMELDNGSGNTSMCDYFLFKYSFPKQYVSKKLALEAFHKNAFSPTIPTR